MSEFMDHLVMLFLFFVPFCVILALAAAIADLIMHNRWKRKEKAIQAIFNRDLKELGKHD